MDRRRTRTVRQNDDRLTREPVGDDDGSGPCQACDIHLEFRMEECPHCGFDANLGRFNGRASDEPTYIPAPTLEAMRRAREARSK